VADGGAHLRDAGDDPALLGLLADGVLDALDVVVDLRVAGVERAVLESVLDLLETGDGLVGEVGGAGRDLLAREGQECADPGDGRDDDQDRGQRARQPAPGQPLHERDDDRALFDDPEATLFTFATTMGLTFALLIAQWPLFWWPLCGLMFRGGAARWIAGLALVRKDGRPAGQRGVELWGCTVVSRLPQDRQQD